MSEQSDGFLNSNADYSLLQDRQDFDTQDEQRESDDFLNEGDIDNNLLFIEGDGLATIGESRGDVLSKGLWRFLNGIFLLFPCFIVWKATCAKKKRLSGKFGHNCRVEFSGFSALEKRVWPSGFGPGWLVRTFCPLILLTWCLILYNGIIDGPKLFDNLQGKINPPRGSPSQIAIDLYTTQFFQTAEEDFPVQTLIVIERIDGSSVLTKEIEIFSRMIQTALYCRPNKDCANGVNALMTVFRYNGYFMHNSEQIRRSISSLYVNGDGSATMIYVQHRIQYILPRDYFTFMQDFISKNGPNEHLYRVSFSNEQNLLNIAQDEVIYDFEHADLIGIPFAWVILFWYCGFPALLVIISLPVCILFSFSMSVYWMPESLSLPTFAPSLIVSMSVALNVDYALFMMVRYYEEIMRGASCNYALDKAMSTAGKTIAVSGTIMLMSNGCLYFVQAETVASLGVSLAATNLITIITNVTLLPALIFVFGPTMEYLRKLRLPSPYSGIRSIIGIALTPCRKWSGFCFKSGRKSTRLRIFQHVMEPTEDVAVSGIYDDGINPSPRIGSYIQELRSKEDFARSESQHENVSELLNFSGSSGTNTQEAMSMGCIGNPDKFHDGYQAPAKFDNLLADGLVENSITVGNESAHASIEMGAKNELDQVPLLLREPDRHLQVEKIKCEEKIRASSTVLSAQSRIWASVAKLCLSYPKTICVVIVFACIPLCLQILRFKYTDSQENIVPMENPYVKNVNTIGSIGLNPGFLADFKAILAPPSGISAQYHLSRDNCFDDDVALQVFEPQLQKALDDMKISITLPMNLTCAKLIDWSHKHGIQKEICTTFFLLGEFFSIIPNHCPYTCDTCRPELVTSKEYFSQTRKVSDMVMDVAMNFSTMNISAGGGYTRVQAPLLESITFFCGRYYDWNQARELLMHSLGSFRGGDETDLLYVERIHNMTGWNGTHSLLRIRPPFHPYDQYAHSFSNKLRDVAKQRGFDGSVDSSNYRFYFGGSVVPLFDQVDAVYSETPPIMIGAVVATVLSMSILVFQSLLLGPRLLITVALTIGLTFGAMVIIFQDLGASPDEAGLYWIVPILGIPIMVGCTLDYDSFVVARIFEMRLAGLSTEAAVFAGLQETGHVITIAGIIMTVAFGSMIFSAVPVVQQIGAVLVCCCLLDTFIVRSLLVPVLILIGSEHNWYPKKMPPVQITMDILRDAARRSKYSFSKRGRASEEKQQRFLQNSKPRSYEVNTSSNDSNVTASATLTVSETAELNSRVAQFEEAT